MLNDIYIRPLTKEDANTSFKWRNDPEIWKFTGKTPDKVISKEIELQWIEKVLLRENEKRFAICIKTTNEYIGNVQLTNIDSYEAEFHIFIGEKKKYWGRGFGVEATKLIVEYAFTTLKLQCVYLFVKKDNLSAVKAYEKAGFNKLYESRTGEYRMSIFATDEIKSLVSIFMMTFNHANFIEKAIESILNQKTDFRYEIVIGEDNSSDGTRQILLNYAVKYKNRFKLILHKENIGANKNQTSVLSACKGRYVSICEGDDYWIDSEKIQKQVEFLESNPDFAICCTNAYRLEAGKKELMLDTTTDSTFSINDLVKRNPIVTATCLFRNINYERYYSILEQAYMGDWTLHVLNAQYGKIKYFKEVTAVYRIHGKGAWSGIDILERTKRVVRNIEMVKSVLPEMYNKLFQQNLALHYKRLIDLCWINNEKKESKKYFAKYIKSAPFLKVLSDKFLAGMLLKYLASSLVIKSEK